ncbi:hypothetical protein KC19_4G045300 [Ceratodon purpureus]|uniref:Uncharacterized protein n=1 Tax=Ceratodon purpureus TaxID=3225 RepID=A0A8T0I6V6_CERPU|nr:hypothetical protein KC19_4G045300 [Ceratodon purpureus]
MWDGYDTKPPLPCALSQLMNDSEVRVITSCDTSHGPVLVSAFAQAESLWDGYTKSPSIVVVCEEGGVMG